MFEDLKNYREVGDFDLLSPTLNTAGLFDAELLRAAIQERQSAGSRHLGLEIHAMELLNQSVMEVIWYALHEEKMQKPGSLAILAPESLRTLFAPFESLNGFLFFASETQMISWSMHHHEEVPELNLQRSPRTISVEAVKESVKVAVPPAKPVVAPVSKTAPKSPTFNSKKQLYMVLALIMVLLLIILGIFL